MKFGICYKPGREESAKIVRKVVEFEGEIVLFTTPEECEDISDLDMMIIVGGDGTVIRCSKCVVDKAPIVGIKAGRLGFLSSYTLDSLEDFVEDLKENSFIVDERWFIDVKTSEGKFIALNDAVFQKDVDGRMLEIEVIAGGSSPMWFFSDGIIVSTPTGSTAYNLSAGGPVVHPKSETLQITPLLPHFLFNRGIVVPADHGIHVVLDEPANLLIDGKKVAYVKKALISKSDVAVKILRSPNYDFFRVVKERLGYGRRLI